MINSSRDQNKQKNLILQSERTAGHWRFSQFPKMKLSCQGRSFISPQSDKCEPESNTKSSVAPWSFRVCLLHDFCIEVHAGIWGHKRAKVWKRRFNAGRESAAGGKVSELWDEAEQKWWPLRVTTACSSALRPYRALSWLFKWKSWSIWAWIDCVEAALL